MILLFCMPSVPQPGAIFYAFAYGFEKSLRFSLRFFSKHKKNRITMRLYGFPSSAGTCKLRNVPQTYRTLPGASVYADIRAFFYA